MTRVFVKDAAEQGYDYECYWCEARERTIQWGHIPAKVRLWLHEQKIEVRSWYMDGQGGAILDFNNPDHAMLFKLTWS